jgi:hypothetical protein
MVIGHLIVIIETQNWVLNGIQTTIDGTDPEFQMEATSCSWKPKNVETIYPLVNVYIAMGNHHHVSPVNQLFLWPFSIAMYSYVTNYQRLSNRLSPTPQFHPFRCPHGLWW